jgi:Domain of unknown function (DUF4430)
MTAGRGGAAVVAVLAAAAAAGCGFGPGPSSEGDATLTVTHDYGREVELEATDSDPSESETVLRMLDREADITTRYGGGFVQSIDGVAGRIEGGHTSDWFFFVNGIESDRGAAEVSVRGGDRIWWDFRDWTAAMRAPAVVGSWPEPFAQASAGSDRIPVQVVCEARRPTCGQVAERLADEGVDAGIESPKEADAEPPALRLLVGAWPRIDDDTAAEQLDRGPATSGVFARFADDPGGWRLLALDPAANTTASLGAGAGLVAALREGDDPPTWLVTGTDAAGVEQAASLLRPNRLAHRYALAAVGGEDVPLPAEGSG